MTSLTTKRKTKRKTVSVIGCTMGGRFFHEGHATFRKWLDGDTALVDFRDGHGPVERFIDPRAQGLGDADLVAYIARLNDPA